MRVCVYVVLVFITLHGFMHSAHSSLEEDFFSNSRVSRISLGVAGAADKRLGAICYTRLNKKINYHSKTLIKHFFKLSLNGVGSI